SYGGASVEASDLEHGPKDHDRFGDTFQQRARDDRGALALRGGNEARGSGDSSAEHRAFDGRVRGRLDSRAIELLGHVFPDSVRRYLAGARAKYIAAARFSKIEQVGI